MNYRVLLKDMGLSDFEIDIYVKLLEKGPLKVTELAKELSMARTSIYRFVTHLHEKGFVSETIETDTKIYSALEPNKLPGILDSQMMELNNIIPQLNNIARAQERSKISIYRGKAGIKIVMNDMINCAKPYTTSGEMQQFFKEAEAYVHQWLKKAEKIKMKGRLLGSRKQKYVIAKTEENRYLPEDLISKTTTITYADNTAIIFWSSPIHVMLINDKEFTRHSKATFDYLWKIGKK